MEKREADKDLLEMRELRGPAFTPLSPRAARSPLPQAPRTPILNPPTPATGQTTGITPRIAFQTPSRPDTPDELDLGLPMIDADDFLAPPGQEVQLENEDDLQGFRLPRAPTLEPARKAAAAARRKARRRALSSSSQNSKQASGARAALRTLGRALSRDSATSSSSSSSTSSNASSISRLGWRFWRNESSDSETDATDDDEDGYVPPEPAYELVLPTLVGAQQPAAQPFTAFPTPSLEVALLRLSAFWQERKQTEHAAGDLAGDQMQPMSEQHAAPTATLLSHPVADRPLGDGAGWWLDIQAPTVHDMRLLRKYVPLHPLTIEDVLHQDPREKVERFDRLRYTLVVFRALDDSYFRWHSPDSPKQESLSSLDSKGSPGKSSGSEVEEKDHPVKLSTQSSQEVPAESRRPRLEICEGIGGKEGLEGVGVGAVNLYLVIFHDGIVSFHYEPLPKHTSRVYNKIQQYGVSRPINSHWIAYGLLDSIVDSFFPIIDFIEHEAKDIDDYLADPFSIDLLGASRKQGTSKVSRWWDRLIKPETIPAPRWLSRLPSMPYLIPRPVGRVPVEESHPLRNHNDHGAGSSWRKDGRALLRKMTETRRLVTAMSRLLTAKTDVTRAVRKRVHELPMPHERDINIYFGDLQDHIATLHQSLVWYESALSHDHPAFAGMLRLGLERAKWGTDYNILRFYIVILIVIPAQVVIGAFSMNVSVPTNGAEKTHVEADGVTIAPLRWFYVICGIAGFIFLVVVGGGWVVLRKLKRPGVGI